MTTVLNVSGGWFPRTITLDEIESIKNAKNQNEIKSLWGKIADWFCGTDKENAKKALFELLNNDDINIKIEAFKQLKTMASPAFKEAFTYTTAINDTAFTVNLSIGALFSIATESEKIKLNSHIKAFTDKYFSDTIADWFCGTDKDNAQKAFFELMNESDVNSKIEAFNQLKSMAPPVFKDFFNHTIEIDDKSDKNDTSFSFVLSIGELISTKKLSTKGKTIEMEGKIKTFTEMCDEERDINLKQLKLDIDRSSVLLFHGSKEPERITKENIDELLVNKISVEQKKSLNVALSQTGMIDICDQIYQNTKEIPMHSSPNKNISLFLDDPNNIIIKIHFYKNLDKIAFAAYKEISPDLKYRCLSANATVEIDSNGRCNITRVNVTHPGIE